MQPNSQTLPPHFVTVEEAIRLIKADKRDDAKVDLQFLVNNIPYMKVKQNYNIRLMKTVNGRAIRDGSVYVTIYTEYEKQILLHAIQEAYTDRTGIKFNEGEEGVNHVSTVVDQEQSRMDARPITTETGTAAGENISKPYEQVINGE